jgi:exodeoxyribonuclease-3
MKLISYNLNGIRAAVKKGLVDWIAENDFDFVGIQETKAWETDIPKELFEEIGYKTYWYSAQKKGYSGVGILSKIEPDKVEVGCGFELYDYEGRVIRADYGDLTVLCIYFPSGSSGDARQAIKMKFLTDIHSWINELRKTRPNLIIMGDYNVANHPIDVYNPDKAPKSSGFLPVEREWLTAWFKDGFVDAFRFINPKKEEYSWWSYRRSNRSSNRGWRIDYQSVSVHLKDKIKACHQLTDVVHSDHCPVYLEIDI